MTGIEPERNKGRGESGEGLSETGREWGKSGKTRLRKKSWWMIMKIKERRKGQIDEITPFRNRNYIDI